MVDMNCPIYDRMMQLPDYDEYFTKRKFNELINFISTYVDAFDKTDRSYDNYMCHFELFAAYCEAGKNAKALSTLERLEEFNIPESDRYLECITNKLLLLGEFDSARGYARRHIDAIKEDSQQPTRSLVAVDGCMLLLRTICSSNPHDPELHEVLQSMQYYIACQYGLFGRGVTKVFDILMPLNLVPASGIVILRSVWSYMKCDEAFGGNNYQDELVKIEAWLTQLSESA